MNNTGIIYGINGPVVYLKGNNGFRMSEMVHVGDEHLVGEVISLSKAATTVQVFEETTRMRGLKPQKTHIPNPDKSRNRNVRVGRKRRRLLRKQETRQTKNTEN